MTNTFAPVHPGEVLREDFLKPLQITPNRLAMDIHVPATRINAIVNGQRSITVDTAMRLGRYLGTGPEIWMSLQTRYDLDIAKAQIAPTIEREVKPLEAVTCG